MSEQTNIHLGELIAEHEKPKRCSNRKAHDLLLLHSTVAKAKRENKVRVKADRRRGKNEDGRVKIELLLRKAKVEYKVRLICLATTNLL